MDSVKIPQKTMPATDRVPCAAVNEPFVDIESYSNGKISIDMQYHKASRDGAVKRAYMRKTVADKLIAANALLPKGYSLKIYDAWRTTSTQKDLYYEYFAKLSELEENQGISVAELHKKARTFVSFPDPHAEFSFVHSSGGAIDLTIIDETGEELDMGCSFDSFSPVAATSYFEDTRDQEIGQLVRNNRRILYTVMTAVGFTNYPPEWWHYDFGDIFWAAITGNAAMYASEYDLKNVTQESDHDKTV